MKTTLHNNWTRTAQSLRRATGRLLLMTLLLFSFLGGASAQVSIPYIEGFETMSSASSLTAAGWDIVYKSDDASVLKIETTNVHSGIRALNIDSWNASSNSAYVIVGLPTVNAAINTLQITFSYKVQAGTVSIGYLTDVDDGSTFVSLQDFAPSSSSFTTETVDLSNAPDDAARIAIKYLNYYRCYIDDVDVRTPPTCLTPQDLTALLTSGNGSIATLNWTAIGSETDWVLQYGMAVDFSDATTVNVTGTPTKDLTGLTSETTYYARVKADCGGGDESEWSNTCKFTPTDALTFTVNDGTTTNAKVPVDGFNADYSQRSEFIIPASTLSGLSGSNLYSMKFYPNYNFTSTGSFQVYLKEVNEETFSGTNFYTAENATTVYTGTLTVSSTEGMTIAFDDEIRYNGGNLLIGFYKEDSDGNYSNSSSSAFYGIEATGASLSIYGTNSATQRNFLPKVTFEYSLFSAPKSLTVSNVTGNTATISWTAPNTDATGYKYRYKTSTGSWTDLTSTTDLSAALTGLTHSTVYTFQVQAIFSGGESSFATITFNTDFQIPYSYGFEDESEMECWTVLASEVYTGLQDNTFTQANLYYDAARTGDNYFLFFYTNTPPNYLISPQLHGIANGLHVEFYYRQHTDGVETFQVGYSTTDNNPASFTWGDEITASTSYQRFSANYPAGTKYVAVKLTSDYQYFLYLDDFTFEESANVLEPAGVQAANITTTSADISWTAGKDETAWDIFVTTDNTVVPDDTTTPTVSNTSDNPYALTGLTPATYYNVYVRANTGTETSPWSSPVIFNTKAEPISLPYSYDFEDEVLPIGWTTICPNTSYNSIKIMDAGSDKDLSFYIASGQSTDLVVAVLPEVDATYSLNKYQMTFDACYANSSYTNMTSGKLRVGIMTDPEDFTTFQLVKEIDLTTDFDTYNSYIVRFNNYTGSGRYIAIQDVLTSNGYVLLDNLEIAELPDCIEPDNLTCTATTGHGATFSWTASDANQSAWQMYYSTTNTAPADDIDVSLVTNADSNPFTLTAGLDPETTYYAWVRGNCTASANGYSSWIGPVSFTTTVACPVPTDLVASNITGHTAQIDWTGYSDSYLVSYRTTASISSPDLSENFSTSSPTGWSRYTGLLENVMNGSVTLSSSSNSWYIGETNGVFDSHARVNLYGTSCRNWLVTPSVTLQDNALLSFEMALTAYNGTLGTPATTGTDDRFVVLVTTDDEATWTILQEWNNAGSTYVLNNIANSATGENVTIDLSSYAGQDVKVAFYGESTVSNADNNLHIDNVIIGTALAAGAWQTTNTDDMTANLTGLAANTKYEVKVKGDCGSDGSSQESASFFFTTGLACIAPTDLAASNPKSNSIDLSWTSLSDAWQICLNDDEVNLIDITNSDVTINGSTGTVFYKLTGLTEITDYTVKVRSNCGGTDGTSQWSSTVNFTTLESCAKPTDLVVSNISHDQADISWIGDSEEFTVNYKTSSIISTPVLSEEFGASTPTDWARYSTLLTDDVLNGSTALSSSDYGWNFGTANGVFDDHARINLYGTSCIKWLVTPSVTLPANPQLAFDMALTGYSGTNVPAPATTGTDDRFVILVSNDDMATWTILRQWDNAGSAYVLNNIANSATGEYVTIDLSSYAGQDVKVAFYGESTVSNADNDLHIDNVTIGAASAAGPLQMITTTNGATTAHLFGLTPGTMYDVTVTPSCDATNASNVMFFSTLELLELDDNTLNGENATTISNYDGKTVSVKLKDRKLWKDGAWNTLCLPFDVVLDGPLAGATVKEMDATTNITGSTLTLNFKDAATIIPAGTPFIIKWDASVPDNIANPIFASVTIDNSATALARKTVESTDGNVSFVGSYDPVDLTAGDQTQLYFGVANTLYWPYEDVRINAFRAHFELSDGSPVKGLNLNFGDGETTSIHNSQLTIDNEASGWYDLQGRKLNGRPKQPGIYLHGGKKVVVK